MAGGAPGGADPGIFFTERSDVTEPSAWPASQVEMRPLAALREYERNARTHSAEQVAQIAAAIREWGWTNPVLVDEAGMVIAGHGRVMAARELGLADVPVMVARGWSDAQKRAYVLADNQLALNAGWDESLLRAELTAIKELDFAIDMIGFPDVDALLAAPTKGLTDPDAAPAAEAEPASRRGDLWICGNHRLLCGDSTDTDAVRRLLAGVKPHLMVTDPPYGVNYDAEWRVAAARAAGKTTDKTAVGKVLNDDRADWREAWRLFPGDVAYVWHGALHNVAVAASLDAAGFPPRSQIVWVKTRAPISRGHYHWQHEPAFYAERDEGAEGWSVEQDNAAYVVRAGKTAHWKGGRKQTTVWFIENVKNETGHSTQKPVECMRRPIVNNSSPGQAIYEPFCGSGTTMIAAEMEGRQAYCMELSEAYNDVIVKRWQAFTGLQATLDGDGRTFAEVAAERLGAIEAAAAAEGAQA